MITSSANYQIKNLVKLNNKAKFRNEQGVFVAEGLKMFLEAPRNKVKQVFVSAAFSKRVDCFDKLDGYPLEIVDDEIFKKAADTKTPQGILCIVEQFNYNLESILKQENNLFIVLESIQDPGNLGTILRMAEGAGVSGVIMNRDTVDIYNPKVIRSTMGSIYRLPFFCVDELTSTVDNLKEYGVKIFAAHLDGTTYYDEQDYTSGTAFVIGNEGKGLSSILTNCADALIKIPMNGDVESLNAGVAASLLAYEANRQRRQRL